MLQALSYSCGWVNNGFESCQSLNGNSLHEGIAHVCVKAWETEIIWSGHTCRFP